MRCGFANCFLLSQSGLGALQQSRASSGHASLSGRVLLMERDAKSPLAQG